MTAKRNDFSCKDNRFGTSATKGGGRVFQRCRVSVEKHATFARLTINYMFVTILKSKLHRVRVTQAELNYVGSITIDEDLMDAVGLLENEQVHIVNNNNGERLITYVIKGERRTGIICLNGAAARRAQVGDIIIIISYAMVTLEEARNHKPTVVFPDDNNRLIKG